MLSEVRFSIFLIILSSITFGFTNVALGGSPTPEDFTVSIPITTPASNEVPTLKRQALDGSSKSAFLLSLYFHQKDPREEIFWLMIAAENGGSRMQSELALALRQRHDELSALRARYWYNRIILTGSIQEAQQARDDLAAWEKSEKSRAH